MGYFKRKRTNKKKGKRGTKRYRGGATNATNQPPNAPTSLPAELEEKMTIFKNVINDYITNNPTSKELINQKMTEILSNEPAM
jgi:hypothetical protein